MKKLFLFPLALPLLTALQAQDLRVDFSSPGGFVEEGYEGYFADHEVSNTFTTQSFSAHGASINITPTWADDTVSSPVDGSTVILDGDNTAKQLIVRGESSPSPDLYQDWIGLDSRIATANPFTLLIEGLPTGDYTLLTHHHDPLNQTGLTELTVTDANGVGAPLTIDQSAGSDLPNVTRVSLVSDGSDIVLSFSNVSGAGGPINEAFIVLNALEIFVNDDSDGDGLPNSYEIVNNLDPNDDGTVGESSPGAKDGPNGALGDPDFDDLTNIQEFQGDDGTPFSGDETDPQNEDSDNDQLLDGEEVSGTFNDDFGNEPTDPLNKDSDDDGISDFEEIEGFINIAYGEPTNPNKADTDDDGMPDAYELENNGEDGLDPNTNDAADDLDGDTLSNLDEFNGVPSGFQTRADVEDTDDDGLGDEVETGTGTWVSSSNTGTNPTVIDSDLDGLEDGEEDPDTTTSFDTAPFPTDPNILDTDSDSVSDGIEAENGTDGSDPNSFPNFGTDALVIMISDLSPDGSPIEEFFNNNFSNVAEIRHGNFSNAAATGTLDALNGTGEFEESGPANVLVIGRSLSSGDYQGGASSPFNALPIPIVNFSSFTARDTDSRLGWHADSVSTDQPRAGAETTVTVEGAGLLGVVSGDYDFFTDVGNFRALGLGTDVGGGDVLAGIGPDLLAAHWDAGDAPGNPTAAGVATFPGTRLLFNLDNEPSTANDGTNDFTGLTPAGLTALVAAIDATTPLKAISADSPRIIVTSTQFTAPNTVTINYRGEGSTTYSLDQNLNLQGGFTATGETNTTNADGTGTFSFAVDTGTNPKQFFQISNQ